MPELEKVNEATENEEEYSEELEEEYSYETEADETEEESSASEEIDEEEQEDESDPLIPITYIDDEGSEKTEELKYSQLGQLVKDYGKAHTIIEQYNTYYQQTLPVINAIQNSKLLQSVLYYKGQGYSDEQILEGLSQSSKTNNSNESNEQPSNLEEQIVTTIAKELDKRIKPIEAQAKFLQDTSYLQSVDQHNNQILGEVLKQHNITNITQPELAQMGALLADMYPGVDLRYLKLTKTAANALVLWLKEQRNKSVAKSKTLAKVNKLPKIINSKSAKPGTVGKINDASTKIPKPMSLDERIKLKQELWK